MGLYFVQALIAETVMGLRRVQLVSHQPGLAEAWGAVVIISGTTSAITKHATSRADDKLLERFLPDDLTRGDISDIIPTPFLILICV